MFWSQGIKSLSCLKIFRGDTYDHIQHVILCFFQGNVLNMVEDIADCLLWAREKGHLFNIDKVVFVVCYCYTSATYWYCLFLGIG